MSLDSSLQVLCRKLGLKPPCVSKAHEYHELLETRMSATSLSALRLPGSCKLVICLDLAAKWAGMALARNDVIRLSGLTKKSYTEALKVVAAMLGLEDRTSLRELAVQFGCTKVVSQAGDLLQRYTKDQCSDIDFGSPMFLCAALLVAARNEKIKIDSAKLKERSGAKKTSFDRLVTELQKYVEEAAEPKKTKSSKRRGGLMEAIDAQIQEVDRAAKRSKLDDEDEDPREQNVLAKKGDYEEWKRKILEKAAKTGS